MRKVLTAVVVLALGGLALPAVAQDAGGAAAPNKDAVGPRVQRMRARVLRQRVGLDDAKAAKVEQILDGFEPERAKLQKEVLESRRGLIELYRAKSDDQKAYADALKRFRDAHRAMEELRNRQFDAVGKELTPKQQTALLLALGKLQGKAKAKARTRVAPRRPAR